MASLSAVIRRAAEQVSAKVVVVEPSPEDVLPERNKADYRLSPFTGKFTPRNAFIKGLVGKIEVEPPGIEADITSSSVTCKLLTGDATLDNNLYYAASYYKQLILKGARLPKFTRWVTSLWPKEERFVTLFAKLGQNAKNETYYLSDREVDIRRCASTPHFSSCFSSNDSPGRLCKEGTGVAIIFSDDENKKMKRRTWAIHVVDPKTKRDGLYILPGRYGNFDEKKVIAAFKQKHPEIDFYFKPKGAAGEVSTKVQCNSGIDGYIYFDHTIVGEIDVIKYEG